MCDCGDDAPYQPNKYTRYLLVDDWRAIARGGNTHDNRIENLREATQAQNAMNNRIFRNGTSAYRGVCFHKPSGKWRSKFQGEWLGVFETDKDAAEAYQRRLSKFNETFSTPLHNVISRQELIHGQNVR